MTRYAPLHYITSNMQGDNIDKTITYQKSEEKYHKPEELLFLLREQTSYGALRKLIKAVAAIIIFVLIALSVSQVIHIVNAAELARSLGLNVGAGLLNKGIGLVICTTLAKSLLGILVTIIVKNLALVLIDISDTLMERNRKEIV